MLKELYKKAMDIVYVNFIWILVSFLGILLTLGAATTALFRVIFQVFKTKEPTNVFPLFIKSFKENFFISTLVYFCLIILGFSTYIMLSYAFLNDDFILMILGTFIGYEVLMFTICFFPTVALFKTKNAFELIKNVLLLSNYHLWTNIKILGSFVFVFLLVFYVHEAFIIVAVGVYGFLVAFHLQKIYNPYIEKLDEKGIS